MQAVDEAVDDRPRQQIEILEPRQNLRIDEARAGDGGVLLQGQTPYMPDFGCGTCFSSSSTSASLDTPSDSARKFVSTR